MPAYKAPLRDTRFLMNEVFDYPAHYQTLSNGELADSDTVDMILEGAADYCENVISPCIKPAMMKAVTGTTVKSLPLKAIKKHMTSLYKAAGRDCLIRSSMVDRVSLCHSI